MSRPKYYFEHNDSEICYQADYFQYEMYDAGLTEMEVYTAIPDNTLGVFWCKVDCFCGDDSSETCGKQCNNYEPRNGKNGCCKHHTSWLFIHGDKITLKRKS